jgi:hypothetical protein
VIFNCKQKELKENAKIFLSRTLTINLTIFIVIWDEGSLFEYLNFEVKDALLNVLVLLLDDGSISTPQWQYMIP